MSSYQSQYADITRRLIDSPKKIGESRIGKINSNFVETMRIDLQKEFPIMDIKWIKFSNVVHELLWMLRGETNIKYLLENQCNIWTDDYVRWNKEKFCEYKKLSLPFEQTKKEIIEDILNERVIDGHTYGDMCKIYGYQWRRFNGKTDQVQNVLDKLKENPDDRRMIIIGHNPTDLEEGNVGLPSCHNYMQFYTKVGEDGRRKLSLHCHIRSNDMGLGNPYNVVQYALIAHIFAKLSDMDVDELVFSITDSHLYHEHFNGIKEWLDRYDKISGKVFKIDVGNIDEDDIEEYIENLGILFKNTLPIDNKKSEDYFIPVRNENGVSEIIDNTYCKAKIEISGNQETIDDFKFEDFILSDYNPQPYIKMKLLT